MKNRCRNKQRREERIAEAKARQAEYAPLTLKQRVEKLDGYAAVEQRARLAKSAPLDLVDGKAVFRSGRRS